jgi:quercetin dioxygenase-like cupin family protein
MSVQMTSVRSTREQYTVSLSAAGLDAPWMEPGPLIRPKASAMQARAWRWRDIEPLIHRSPEFMAPGRGAERRILRLDNPGVPERTAGHTISIAVQYLLPGEVAPAHRHTPNAVRFMLHGEGAYTTIEGDKFLMRRGDLVVTPSMTWHDHGNEGTGPVIWTDALDSPVVRYLENLAMDPYEGETQPIRSGPPARHLHYRWESAYAELLGRAGARLLSADATTRRSHPRASGDLERGLSRRGRDGLHGGRRRPDRVGRGRLLRRAAAGTARARQRGNRARRPVLGAGRAAPEDAGLLSSRGVGLAGRRRLSAPASATAPT